VGGGVRGVFPGGAVRGAPFEGVRGRAGFGGGNWSVPGRCSVGRNVSGDTVPGAGLESSRAMFRGLKVSGRGEFDRLRLSVLTFPAGLLMLNSFFIGFQREL
jgi:hypothetical protein